MDVKKHGRCPSYNVFRQCLYSNRHITSIKAPKLSCNGLLSINAPTEKTVLVALKIVLYGRLMIKKHERQSFFCQHRLYLKISDDKPRLQHLKAILQITTGYLRSLFMVSFTSMSGTTYI